SFLGQLAGFALGMLAQSPRLSATMKMVVVEALAHADEFLRKDHAASAPADPFASLGGMARVLIDDRNNVVLRELKSVIANEHKVHDVAVFYGAGHMVDLEARIIGELGYKPGADVWTTAIRADPKDAGRTPDEA